MLKITKGQQGQSLKYVVDSLLLLVDSYACAIYVRESWFFIVVFVCVSFFHTQALEDNQEKMAGMTNNQPSQWWWLESHTTTNRSPWLQSTLSGICISLSICYIFFFFYYCQMKRYRSNRKTRNTSTKT